MSLPVIQKLIWKEVMLSLGLEQLKNGEVIAKKLNNYN
jgi:hypothetical protein